MRALVTGSEGFLGANLCKMLLSQGHQVTACSLNRQKHTSLDALGVDCRTEYGDVTDAQFVERVIANCEADWVFHLAAVSIVRVAQASPALALRTNIMGTVNVLEACRRLPGVKSIVCASSDKAYGDHGGEPYREDMPLLPVAPYEVSKAAADLIAQSYAATYGLNVMVTRCANLYGPGDLNWSRLVPNSCRQALAGLAPVVHQGVAHMRRDYLYIRDAVIAYICLAERGESGAYNVGNGDVASTLDIASAIAAITGGPSPVCEPKAQPFSEINAQELQTSKIRALGWQPQVRLAEGLNKTVGWYNGYLGGRGWVHLCAS